MSQGRWSISRSKLFCAALFVLGLYANPARAQNASWPPPLSVTGQQLSDPQWWPNDPDFGGDWDKWAWTPQVALDNPKISAEEKAAGIGMGLDAAWQRSKGDPSVIIAVMDSGFLWDRSDLLNKWYLNRKELPPPNRADCVGTDPYDCNGDGIFNLRDYTTAGPGQLPSAAKIADRTLLARPDHGDVNGNGWLDPQDLIAIFSDGKDGYGTTVDGNGYIDDICGWDFLWDDNDPTDDVLNGGQGYSHGSAEASDSANEGNNGNGDIGGCPACMVIPLRTGDSFVAHATHQAMAMYYGVSRGVSVFQAAQITLDNSPMVQDAINYAWTHGAVLVASSADETSLHQMVPGNLEHPILVNGHYYDGHDWNDPNNTTYTNFSNGTNWGGHIALSGCSSSGSDSTARHAGVFGLIFSYARQLNLSPPLSAAEAYQLAIEHTFDINKPGSGLPHTGPDGKITYTEFHMGPGWDAHSGYGRVNTRASLDALFAGKIPPGVDITSPLWFDLFDPTRVPSLNITGLVNGSRAPGFDYTMEVAYGLEPVDADFHAVAQGSGTGNMDVSASLPLAGLVANVSAAPGVDSRTYPNGGPHQFAVTLRIRATAHYGGTIGDAVGEARKTIFVHQDDDLLPGYPHKLANFGKPGAPSASGESSPKLVDLDGDGKDEIVFGTADGYIHAMKMDFTELPGFPVRVGRELLFTNHPGAVIDDAGTNDAWQEILSTCAVGDIDGDGKMEIVVGTIEGALYAIRLDGTIEPGFPVQLGDATLPSEVPDGVGGFKKAGMWTTASTDGGLPVQRMNEVEKGFFASPVLADLDGDGKLDIVQGGMDGYMHVWNYQGHELPGFPVALVDPKMSNEGNHFLTIRGRLIGTPAVGDVDNDGKPEILAGSNESYGNNTSGRAYLIRANGGFQTGWPIKLAGVDINVLPYVGRGNPDSPIIADLDGDGRPELLTHVVATQAKAFNLQGQEVMETSTDNTSQYSTATSKQGFNLIAVNSGSVADLDGDGKLDYIDGTIAGYDLITGSSGAVRHDYDHQVNVWSAGRTIAAGRDQAPMLDAFPQLTTDYQFLTNYTVADINGDGYPEVISDNGGYLVTAFDSEGKAPAGWPKLTGYWNMATPAVGDLDGDGYLDVVVVSRNGYLWAWKTKGKANQTLQWESYHHDLRNSGDFSSKEIVRAGPGGSTTGQVRSGGCGESGVDAWALLSGLSVLARMRRRKGRA